jgi:hypothetical protein
MVILKAHQLISGVTILEFRHRLPDESNYHLLPFNRQRHVIVPSQSSIFAYLVVTVPSSDWRES